MSDHVKLTYKRVAKYFKHDGLEIYVERLATGELLLSDKLVMVRVVCASADLAPYTDFNSDCKQVRFEGGKAPAMDAQVPSMHKFWDGVMDNEWHPLTLTRDLRETPGDPKGGVLWRKFTFKDTQQVERHSWFNKRAMDLFSPDLDELEKFQFEQVGHTGPMRVLATYGPCALVMPGHNIESK